MEWINFHASIFDSEEFLLATDLDRSTWIFLQRYCCGQENDGRISGASEWTNRMWQQVCRISLGDVKRKTRLWEWDGNDLIVTFYNSENQETASTNRTRASKAGHASAAKRRKIAESVSTPSSTPSSTTTPSDSETPSSTGSSTKEREGKGREEKGKEYIPKPAERRDKVGILPTEQFEDLQQRLLTINACKGRKSTTRWNAKEWLAFKAAGLDTCTTETFFDQANLVLAYYTATLAQLSPFWGTKGEKAGDDYRRRDLLTLLNFWSGEVDKAQAYNAFQSKIDSDRESGRL